MSNSLKQAARKAEKEKEERRQEKIRKHKCSNCAFGSWTGTKYYCPFGSCARDNLRR